MSKLLFLLAVLSMSFTSCEKHNHSHEDADQNKTEQKREAIALTHYTQWTELFVEFEPFVRHKPSTFLAHFTTLSDFKPVAKAKVRACLEYHKGQKECFSVDGSKFAGIFKPIAIPKYTGEAELSITIELEGRSIVHQLGKYSVYPSIDKITNLKKEEGNSDISYLKEQQWKVDFEIKVANRRTIRSSIPTFAQVTLPSNTRQSVFASLSGVVVSRPTIKLGSEVKAGDVVAYILPTLAKGQDTATLQFEYTKAKSTLTLAKSKHNRIQKLYKQKAISLKRAEEAKQKYEIAKAAFESIEKKLLRFNSTDTNNGIALKSYIDGKVVALDALNGSYVQEGDAIIEIASPSKVWLKAGVSQSQIESLGSPTGITLLQDNKDRVLARSAKLLYFSDLIDSKTRKAYAVFELNNTQSPLKIGSLFAAKLYSDRARKAITLPLGALINDNGEHIVFVQTGGESFERRVVELGDRDTGYVEVRLGVKEGERVVTQGAYRVLLAALAPSTVGDGHAH